MNTIRSIVRKYLLESIATSHFKERMRDRLVSDYTNFKEEKPEIKRRIYDDIEFLETIQFPGQHNIGVLLGTGSVEYIYHQEVNGATEHSQGRYIWVVLRANELETIVFGNRDYLPRNTQYHLRIERIKEFIEEENNGERNLTDKALRKLLSPKQQSTSSSRKVPVGFENLPVVELLGKEWFVDEKNQQIVYTKNIKKTMSLDDALEQLPEEEAEKIFDTSTWSYPEQD